MRRARRTSLVSGLTERKRNAPLRPPWFSHQQESWATLLNHPWPPDLHPAEAGFKTWTETILRRMGYWDDPTRLDELTADEFLRIETAGVATLADLIEKGNAAIASHENQADRPGHSIVIAQWGSHERAQLRRLTRARWPHQIWRLDPRFTDLLPNTDQTVAKIATGGATDDQKELYRRLPYLRDRLTYYRSRRDESLRVFVSGITGQTDLRLEVLLAMAGFTQPRITQKGGGTPTRGDSRAHAPTRRPAVAPLGPVCIARWRVAAPGMGGSGQAELRERLPADPGGPCLVLLGTNKMARFVGLRGAYGDTVTLEQTLEVFRS